MSEKYKVGDGQVPHFITSTVVDWVDLLTRPVYKDIIIDSKALQGKEGAAGSRLL